MRKFIYLCIIREYCKDSFPIFGLPRQKYLVINPYYQYHENAPNPIKRKSKYSLNAESKG